MKDKISLFVLIVFFAVYSSAAESAKRSFPMLPSGPSSPRPFGAYYTRLNYTPEWDKPWRMGEYADVVVRFDNSPVKFVFWHGANYAPCWVTETNIWYCTQWWETGDVRDRNDLMLECEPIMDMQCRYSHVRVIESTPARVVVHWRYAAADKDYRIAFTDKSGWGEWIDEYYTIYPDGSCIRKATCRSSKPCHEGWSSDVNEGITFRQSQESIIIHQPGTKPDDNIELAALTVANLEGENKTFVWNKGAPKPLGMPKNACIEVVNLKAKYKPFNVVDSNNVVINLFGEFWGETHAPDSNFPCWGHWPVSRKEDIERFDNIFKEAYLGKIPWSEGSPKLSKFLSYDRPSHSSVSYTFWDLYEKTDNSFTRISLNGLTDKPVADIVPLAKSWIHPAEIKALSKNYSSKGFDKSQKAYILTCEKNGEPSKLKLELSASRETPIFNPAFVIQNWGDAQAKLKINGKQIKEGNDLKFGYNRKLEGTDLIVWIKIQSENSLTIEIKQP